MIEDTLAQYTGIPKASISRIIKMPQATVYDDQEYQGWIRALDSNRLHTTLPLARSAYDRHLPEFVEGLHARYSMKDTPMSSYTLGNWLVGFLQYPSTLANLSEIHNRIPQHAFRELLPLLLNMLDDMPAGREDWQRALALMALPLLAPHAA